jgi:hypothetical protein
MVETRPPATILQFCATLDTRKPEDKIREFVVAYYFEDRAFVVYELRVPNSGFRSGKFMQKQVLTNPKTGKPYEPHEIFIGARLELAGWRFVLQEASEDALKIMEAHSDEFVKCDLAALLRIVREKLGKRSPQLLVELQRKDPRKRRRLSLLDLQDGLGQFGLQFGDQEFLTLFRRYQVGQSDQFDYEAFVRDLVN